VFEHILGAGRAVTPGRVRALSGAGSIAYWQNDYPAARALYEEAIAGARELGDDRLLVDALYNLGFLPIITARDIDAGLPYFEEGAAVARKLGLRHEEALSRAMVGYITFWKGDAEAAVSMVEAAVQTFREEGRRFDVADSLTGLGGLYLVTGRLDRAREALRESLRSFREVANPTGWPSPCIPWPSWPPGRGGTGTPRSCRARRSASARMPAAEPHPSSSPISATP
jgi:tetratricopeptide (TPR) repeat protein